MTSSGLMSKRIDGTFREVTKQREGEPILDENGVQILDEDGFPEFEIIEYTETEVVTPFEDGMVYDEVIETEIEGRVCYENGKIIPWENSKEKEQEDLKDVEREIESKKNRSSQIVLDLWKLKTEKDWLELLWEDTTEIDTKIQSLKDEYKML